MSNLAIRAKGISKRYKIRHESQYVTIREEIINCVKRPLRFFKRGNVPNHSNENLWALKDVSFDVKRGEVIGIIGRNGAGKTTLLKILSRITHPTEGRIELNGSVSSLLEIGTGFHAELTGRENIYFNGAILGMKTKEVKKKFDEIVAFSEIEKFLDTPVKRYSSGMFVRLAFAVAAHLESEILLIDEILSVGDIAFQEKCLGKMNNLANRGRTVLFVTHNMAAASNLCSSGILLEKGRILKKGSISDIIDYYLKETSVAAHKVSLPEDRKGHSDEFRFVTIRIYGMNRKETSKILLSEGFDIEIEYEVLREIRGSQIEFVLWNDKAQCIFVSTDLDPNFLFDDVVRMPGRYIARCHVPGLYLRCGRYHIDISAYIRNSIVLDSLPKVLSFEVMDDKKMLTKLLPERPGVITPVLEWDTQRI